MNQIKRKETYSVNMTSNQSVHEEAYQYRKINQNKIADPTGNQQRQLQNANQQRKLAEDQACPTSKNQSSKPAKKSKQTDIRQQTYQTANVVGHTSRPTTHLVHEINVLQIRTEIWQINGIK